MADISLLVNSESYDNQDTVNDFLEGDSFDFLCVVSSGLHTATVSWTINGVTTDGVSTTRVLNASSIATCLIVNFAGAATKQVNLPEPAEPQDCYEILTTHGRNTSGIYWIYPIVNGSTAPTRMQVWCDMDTDGLGWTVFQRRVDGSEDFYRDWADYKAGFGDPAVEYWLGNDNIYALVNNGKTYQLRLDLFDGSEWAYDLYASFVISDEADNYKLTLGADIGGGAGDSLTYHDGHPFTTRDVDNDLYVENCAVTYKGAWWYDWCHRSNLNGLYLNGSHSTVGIGINYSSWKGLYYSLIAAEMKARPAAP
ncbi:microfibril-associated glycoprotein 4-like [Amphiura filiformis]|uniref:microfibril-associated glycoprotein 4-like n=1 Tax=Amphiura filiformis TaxID=82378 RepID=UPI003B228EA7